MKKTSTKILCAILLSMPFSTFPAPQERTELQGAIDDVKKIFKDNRQNLSIAGFLTGSTMFYVAKIKAEALDRKALDYQGSLGHFSAAEYNAEAASWAPVQDIGFIIACASLVSLGHLAWQKYHKIKTQRA